MKFQVIFFLVIVLLPQILFSGLKGDLNNSIPIMEVTVIDVWQGDSIFLMLPNKKTVLVDAGLGAHEYSSFDAAITMIVPFLKRKNIRHLNYVVLTHPHHDHIGGMPVIFDNFEIDTVYDCGMVHPSETYMKCLQLIDENGVKYIIPKAGDYLDWDPSIKVIVLGPGKDMFENPNNNSIVLRIAYGAISFLLTGDIEEDAEQLILDLKYDISSTVLKSAHHGSSTSSSEDFIKSVLPECVAVSVGRNNKFRHPHPSTINRYKKENLDIYRTDYHGDITFLTDGRHYQVNLEKEINQ